MNASERERERFAEKQTEKKSSDKDAECVNTEKWRFANLAPISVAFN